MQASTPIRAAQPALLAKIMIPQNPSSKIKIRTIHTYIYDISRNLGPLIFGEVVFITAYSAERITFEINCY